MDIKEQRKSMRRLLWRWANVAVYCASRQKRIGEMEAEITGAEQIKAIEITGLPTTRQIKSTTELAAEQVIRLKELYVESIASLSDDIEKELRFEQAIDGAMKEVLTDTERAVIECRYKREWKFERIAWRFGYSKSQVERHECTAINKLVRKRIFVEQLKDDGF